MKSIRRFYFYLVAFISIEVVLWGLVGLLRSVVDDMVSGGADALAQALALILVGVPIFLVHWLWAQRVSARDEEEKYCFFAGCVPVWDFACHVDSGGAKHVIVH